MQKRRQGNDLARTRAARRGRILCARPSLRPHLARGRGAARRGAARGGGLAERVKGTWVRTRVRHARGRVAAALVCRGARAVVRVAVRRPKLVKPRARAPRALRPARARARRVWAQDPASGLWPRGPRGAAAVVRPRAMRAVAARPAPPPRGRPPILVEWSCPVRPEWLQGLVPALCALPARARSAAAPASTLPPGLPPALVDLAERVVLKDAACPISTRGGTRLVRLVRGTGGGGGDRASSSSDMISISGGGANATRSRPRPSTGPLPSSSSPGGECAARSASSSRSRSARSRARRASNSRCCAAIFACIRAYGSCTQEVSR